MGDATAIKLNAFGVCAKLDSRDSALLRLALSERPAITAFNFSTELELHAPDPLQRRSQESEHQP